MLISCPGKQTASPVSKDAKVASLASANLAPLVMSLQASAPKRSASSRDCRSASERTSGADCRNCLREARWRSKPPRLMADPGRLPAPLCPRLYRRP